MCTNTMDEIINDARGEYMTAHSDVQCHARHDVMDKGNDVLCLIRPIVYQRQMNKCVNGAGPINGTTAF